MRIGFKRLLAASVLSALLTPHAQAQQAVDDSWLYQRVSEIGSTRSLQGRKIADLRSHLMATLGWSFPVTAMDREIAAQVSMASHASRELERIFAHYLDGDGRVTKAEFEISLRQQEKALGRIAKKLNRDLCACDRVTRQRGIPCPGEQSYAVA